MTVSFGVSFDDLKRFIAAAVVDKKKLEIIALDRCRKRVKPLKKCCKHSLLVVGRNEDRDSLLHGVIISFYTCY